MHGCSARTRPCFALLLLWASLALSGCATQKFVELREVPRNPLTARLNLLDSGGPQPTERTVQLLRRYDLLHKLDGDPSELLEELHHWVAREPNAEHFYAVAELAYIGAKKKEESDPKTALDLYGASVMHAYLHLFDPSLNQGRNPYDPQFRGASELYNSALEGALRIERKAGVLRPGVTHTITTASREVDVTVALHGKGWQAEDIDHFEFVSDFEVAGLRNHYRTYGLGVPLIAVRKDGAEGDPAGKYYPPKLSFPVTAFLRIIGQKESAKPGEPPRMQAVLDLCDPLLTPELEIAGRTVPLESDVTTPLAYFLSQPEMDTTRLSTYGLLNPAAAQQLAGIYMLEPFQPGKIPVIMVHGLWSTPVTWMEMFNDLRSDPSLRNRYQFWFYLYPTGEPFWFSAAKMRADLAEMRQTLDPDRGEAALDQMVLVGHSMGGLVSKLQTVDSGGEFWRLVSDRPFAELKADKAAREKLASTFFFRPNPSVRRVVTIGTPHLGSDYANSATRWLGHRLITVPMQVLTGKQNLMRDNPEFFPDSSLLAIGTSIDSLAPESPLLPVLYEAPAGAGVAYHTIIGEVAEDAFIRRIAGTSDGVVHVNSAKLKNAKSQITVTADHSTVHAHPRAILEVRRILLEHLDQARQEAFQRYDAIPASAEQAAM